MPLTTKKIFEIIMSVDPRLLSVTSPVEPNSGGGSRIVAAASAIGTVWVLGAVF